MYPQDKRDKMSNLRSIDLKESEHRPNFRILAIESEIQELKQVLYWMKIIDTYNKSLNSLDPPTWDVPQHGILRTTGWGNIEYVQSQIKMGEEMIDFLKELLRLNILWY